GGRIVGITAEDLFIPVLTFVFGQAQLGGPAAVVSGRRLHTDFYGLPSDDRLLVDRAVKEVVHELGHGFGLVPCPDRNCVMSSSTYVEDVDLKGEEYCAACHALLANSVSERPLA
ncbi:MAG: archemetzincin, partial [Gemmatimonadota bacterium]